MKENTHVLVLGGGFAGVESAIQLRKLGHQVTLVSNRDYLFVYPISIWIPVKKKSFNHVKLSLKTLSKKHGFSLVIDDVEHIISSENRVKLSSSEICYEYLVVAIGMSKMKMKGLEHTHSICGQPKEAGIIKEELEKLVQQGRGSIAIGFGGNPKDPTATAVRGGPAFEMLFNFSHYLKKLKLREQFDLHFFAPMAEPGRKMGEKAYQKMDSFFDYYKIQVHKGKKIARFGQSEIHFEDDSVLKSDLIIFIPGGSGHQVLESSDLPLSEVGFIRTNQQCQVEGKANVFAVGDVATLIGPKWAAKQGHLAEVMGKVAAKNIDYTFRGKKERESYTKHLNIICVMDSGDGAAFVMRKENSELMLPLPIIGHWMKQFWGFYYRQSKLKNFPRLPGM
ncbi:MULTISPECIES: NAD(P)/FAD-dependent oxidoreductase [unclassified Lentimicrobium]|uniref:NAD(P)/FAD-dependent oxidoreductase n=1 Tax=unclassified Lentimicrobium TaxID=2677434 RepID=UPI0015543848|nr:MULTISPECIES: FAD-dependent oxidoreductase [unclassified Lentimicrobium]NPD46158.1 FAD-dependent oxidoreductase [Lentimicrobium sp. S6]NPD83209.1 FAD-dependent oxidoreductase [Lentimicrobium sp. L6]